MQLVGYKMKILIYLLPFYSYQCLILSQLFLVDFQTGLYFLTVGTGYVYSTRGVHCAYRTHSSLLQLVGSCGRERECAEWGKNSELATDNLIVTMAMQDMFASLETEEKLELLYNNSLVEGKNLEILMNNTDQFFLIVIAIIIFFMQCGFAFLEAGSVR